MRGIHGYLHPDIEWGASHQQNGVYPNLGWGTPTPLSAGWGTPHPNLG